MALSSCCSFADLGFVFLHVMIMTYIYGVLG